MMGHCQNSSRCIKLGVAFALNMPCALGPWHTASITVKSQVKIGPINDNKTVYILLEALALSAVSTSKQQIFYL